MSPEATNQPNVADGLFAGKVIAIIGASTGIGAAAARLFIREGAALMLGARSDDRLAELAEKLRRDGAVVEHCRCDIGSVADTAALVDKHARALRATRRRVQQRGHQRRRRSAR